MNIVPECFRPFPFLVETIVNTYIKITLSKFIYSAQFLVSLSHTCLLLTSKQLYLQEGSGIQLCVQLSGSVGSVCKVHPH